RSCAAAVGRRDRSWASSGGRALGLHLRHPAAPRASEVGENPQPPSRGAVAAPSGVPGSGRYLRGERPPARTAAPPRSASVSHYDLRDIADRLARSTDAEAVAFEFLGALQTAQPTWHATLAFYEVSRDALVRLYERDKDQLRA